METIYSYYRCYSGIMGLYTPKPVNLDPSSSRGSPQTLLDRGYIGIMERKMDTTLVYWGHIIYVYMVCRDSGKGNGNYYIAGHAATPESTSGGVNAGGLNH